MSRTTVMIMAAGTGGHIFPALSIARALQEQGCRVEWLGTPDGMEAELVGSTDITLHKVTVSGVRGKGISGLLGAPWMVFLAVSQAMTIIRLSKPCCVLGMGGYVTGPGGLAAWMTRTPLLIHEQNAVAGFSNRVLSRFASKVMETFPGTFPASAKVLCTGNPVRQEIEAIPGKRQNPAFDKGALNVLVLGGSQGAVAINTVIPEALARLPEGKRPQIRHQTGKRNCLETRRLYEQKLLPMDDSIEVVPFIQDMAEAYLWADVVICRAGATTVSEIAAAGLPSVLIPYPHAVDDHQRRNALWLSKAGAAVLIDQSDFTSDKVTELFNGFMSNAAMLRGMAEAACSVAQPDAAGRVAAVCMEVCFNDG